MAALRAKLRNKTVWVTLDEWTDSQGNAICNIIVGSGKQHWVVATHTLQCHGPNNGVEHTEVGKSVVDTLTSLGIASSNVILFICDAASVLNAAYTYVLAPLYPAARHIACPSHGMNLAGKAMVCALPAVVSDIFVRGPAVLHAKKYASCRRRWFAFCRTRGIKPTLPPKHINTR